MPEAPDLEVVLEVLAWLVTGRRITYGRVLRPIVLRSLAARDFASDVVGREVEEVSRRGKFLLLVLSGEAPPDACHHDEAGSFQGCVSQSPSSSRRW